MVEAIIKEESVSSSATEEYELVPKMKLIKKGQTFTQALKAKRAKTTPQKIATAITIKETAPKQTRVEVLVPSRRDKGKHIELTGKTIHPKDPEYDDMMAVI